VEGLQLPWAAPEGRLLLDIADVTAYLFLEDEPAPVDAVLVFGGQAAERALPAADLYRRGWVRRIIVSGGPPRGAPAGHPTEAAAMRSLLLARGVAEEAVLVEPRARSTLENVLFSLPHLRGVRALALATKPAHMRRAAMTVRRHLPGTRLLCLPAPLPDCGRTNWWTRPGWRRTVADELAAIARYAARGDIAPLDR
jgi:uncharacterized SAM-binding protein YcdF (DUF218 family)